MRAERAVSSSEAASAATYRRCPFCRVIKRFYSGPVEPIIAARICLGQTEKGALPAPHLFLIRGLGAWSPCGGMGVSLILSHKGGAGITLLGGVGGVPHGYY